MLFLSFRMVFSKWPYLAITGAITGLFWVIFNVFNELLFFSPIVTFYLPEDAIVDFILSSITAVLMGVLVSMNVFVLKHSKNLKVSIGSLLSVSTLSIVSSTCATCSSLGFVLVFILWRNRGGRVSLSIQLSDTSANSFDSPFGMGIIFSK